MATVYIGIDPTAGRRPMDCAILDDQLHVVEQAQGPLTKILARVRAFPAAVVAVDAPQSLNAGLMASPARRRRYRLPAHSDTWADFKVCEYELRRRGIKLYNTPARLQAAPVWMRTGFKLYAELKDAGYKIYRPGLVAPRTLIEVHPHACFSVLLGHLPLPKDTLLGRLQRQLVLYEEGLQLPDPMNAFEEVTRHWILEGGLDLPGLMTHDRLDALVAAYTAYLLAHEPRRLTLVGDSKEGQIAVPVARADFKDEYR